MTGLPSDSSWYEDLDIKELLEERDDMMFGELKSIGLSDAKTHSLIYKYLPFAAKLLERDVSELSILERDGVKFELIERYPTIKKFGFDEIENHHIQMQGYSSGIFLHEVKDRMFVKIRFLADIFFIYETGQLGKILRELKVLPKKNAVKPILEEGLLDKILNETLVYYKNRSKLEEYGIKARKGVVLNGPAGNGKTLCLKYIKQLCRKKNIKYNTITSSELEMAYSKNQLDDIFDEEGITVLDDIDTDMLDRRKDGKRTCAILAAMDGVESSHNSIRIFTTNEDIDNLDSALLRPGRLDCVFTFKKPTSDLRLKFVNTWHKDILEKISIEDLIKNTENYSFAELQGIKVEIASRLVRGDSFSLEDLLGLKIDVKEHTKKKKKLGFGDE